MKKFLCKIFGHKYEIVQVTNRSGKYINYHRYCDRCNHWQSLERPKKYHPSKYLWTDLK